MDFKNTEKLIGLVEWLTKRLTAMIPDYRKAMRENEFFDFQFRVSYPNGKSSLHIDTIRVRTDGIVLFVDQFTGLKKILSAIKKNKFPVDYQGNYSYIFKLCRIIPKLYDYSSCTVTVPTLSLIHAEFSDKRIREFMREAREIESIFNRLGIKDTNPIK